MVRVNVVLIGLLLLTVTDVSTTCGVVIFRIRVSCITSVASVDGNILWLLIWLANYVAMLLVVCQLSRDVIGYEYSALVMSLARFDLSILSQLFVNQIVGWPVLLS